ncbi:MAG: hypothetical protein KDA25_05690 [Phycisphaerales bacterium]|nr:hypothetical protein [Phycisphaerales bacterium]
MTDTKRAARVTAASSDHGVGDSRRDADGVPFDRFVALVLLVGDGGVSAVQVLRATELSPTGICVKSKQMMHPQTQGAIQIMRQDGTFAIIGVEVRHCQYVGDLAHAIGLRFVPLHERFRTTDFLDDDGRMPLLDRRLSL